MGVPPSASDAVTLQVRAVDVVTLVAGLRLRESTVGRVFSMMTLASASSVAPLVSTTVALQVTVSPGPLVVGVSTKVESDPRSVERVSLVQA